MPNPREIHMVKVETNANANKFYRMTLDAGTLTKNWGRVGATGQTKVEPASDYEFDRTVNEKKRRGYTEVAVIQSAVVPTMSLDQGRLKEAAKVGLVAADKGRGKTKRAQELDDLIDRLVAANKHQILETSGGLITINTNGQVTSPLGVISGRAIADARATLLRIQRTVAGSTEYIRLLEDYLRLVPQKVPSRAGWADTFFTGDRTFDRQLDFLDQISATIGFADAARDAAIAAATADEDTSQYANLFRLKVGVLDDRKEFARIQALFDSTKSSHHSSSSLRLKRVFVLIDTDEANKAFDDTAARLGNIHAYRHGTRAGNLLSILRKGLIVPPRSGSSIQVQGRMFGDGTYFSEHATKSLNYSEGGTWDRGARDKRCFMLLNDVVMGNEYRPVNGYNDREAHHGTNPHNGKPYDSINVKARTAGIRNHEAVVWRSEQIRPRYICEFEG